MHIAIIVDALHALVNYVYHIFIIYLFIFLLQKARERVYGEEETSGAKSKYFLESLSLEESPKWNLLSLILREVRDDRKKREDKIVFKEEENKEIKQDSNVTHSQVDGGILIVANDERTCYQLRQVSCQTCLTCLTGL